MSPATIGRLLATERHMYSSGGGTFVAGLIWRRNLRVSSSTWRCPWVTRFSEEGAMPAARRTGPRNVLAAQMVISACCTAGPYRGGRYRWICLPGSATRTQSPRRYRCPACCRTREVYLLQCPVDSQKSSSIADFLLFPAFRYACAFTIVSFLRSWNHPSEYAPRIRQHPRGHRELHSRCSVLIRRTSNALWFFTHIFS